MAANIECEAKYTPSDDIKVRSGGAGNMLEPVWKMVETDKTPRGYPLKEAFPYLVDTMEGTQKCTNCHAELPLSEFRICMQGVKKGEWTAICGRCMDQHNIVQREAKHAWEDTGSEAAEEDAEDGRTTDLGKMSAEDFLDTITCLDVPYAVHVHMNIATVAPQGRNSELRQHADKVANAIGEVLLLHWRRLADCEQKPKVPKGQKPCDARCMERFNCHGWLHLTVNMDLDVIGISLKHCESHKPYKDIRLPEEWKEFIKKQAGLMTPGEIWKHLVSVEMKGKSALDPSAALLYRVKSVYYYWLLCSCKGWRLANDPLKSVELWLEKHGEEYHVKCLPIEPVPGTEALAFYVTDFVEGWGVNTQVLAMDSTCSCSPPPPKPYPHVHLLVDGHLSGLCKSLCIALDPTAISSALAPDATVNTTTGTSNIPAIMPCQPSPTPSKPAMAGTGAPAPHKEPPAPAVLSAKCVTADFPPHMAPSKPHDPA
ncbi:hypothetical protein C8Q79DRAFT_929391 [Trametes meyenii]|nr:hypothetical protein C8Q79DRAFT_929391 [Trametes meyenii]